MQAFILYLKTTSVCLQGGNVLIHQTKRGSYWKLPSSALVATTEMASTVYSWQHCWQWNYLLQCWFQQGKWQQRCAFGNIVDNEIFNYNPGCGILGQYQDHCQLKRLVQHQPPQSKTSNGQWLEYGWKPLQQWRLLHALSDTRNFATRLVQVR